MADLVYKIGLLGPTRVGKTSLVSAALAEAQKFLAGTPVSFVPVGPTRERIHANRQDLDGALAMGSFDPGALAGSEAITVYELALEVPKSRLPVRVLDYPGGWLTNESGEFQAVRQWFSESSILVVPIDAVVAMEFATTAESKAARKRLNIPAIEASAVEWAKARVAKRQPGAILFAPVKCESYFSDNGSGRNRADDLYSRTVEALYRDVVESVRAEDPTKSWLRAYYMPVDTMGCVDLVSTDWRPGPDGGLECHAKYRVVIGDPLGGRFQGHERVQASEGVFSVALTCPRLSKQILGE